MAGGKGKGTRFAVSIAIQARDMASRVVRGVSAGMRRSFEAVSSSLKRLTGGFRRLVDFGAKLGTVFATWGAWIGRLGGHIKDVVLDTADWGTKISHLATKTGLATDTLQELAYAGSDVGVSQEVVFKSMEVLSRRFGEMHAGSKTLYTFLSQVGGPTLAKQAKAAQTMDERLELMLVAMARITDEEKRLAFATQVFGEEGRDMVLMLAGGTQGLKDLRQAAHDYHQVMEKEALADAMQFGDELNKVQKTWAGAKRVFGLEVLRALRPDIQRLTTWLRENPESIRKIARELGAGVATAVRGIRDAVEWIWTNRDDILTWAKRLAIVFGVGGILGSITGIVAGLGAIAVHPAIAAIGAIAAAVGAMVLGLERLRALTPAQVKDTAAENRRRFGSVGGAMATVGTMMGAAFAGNIQATGALGEGLGRSFEDEPQARYEATQGMGQIAALGSALAGLRAQQRALMITPSPRQDVAVKVTLDGPAAGTARVTEVEGAARVEKRVGVRAAGSGLP